MKVPEPALENNTGMDNGKSGRGQKSLASDSNSLARQRRANA